MEGSLVLGGYDAAKADCQNISIPFVDHPNFLSGLLITIANTKMNLRRGLNPSILGPSEGSAIRSCTSPDYPIVSLSLDIWSSFVAISGVTSTARSLGPNYYSELISRDNALVSLNDHSQSTQTDAFADTMAI